MNHQSPASSAPRGGQRKTILWVLLASSLPLAAQPQLPPAATGQVDYFKDVNDTYGHEAGDVVLKTLAETVIRKNRHGDFVCRYGGEEFALVLPDTGKVKAVYVASRLRGLDGGFVKGQRKVPVDNKLGDVKEYFIPKGKHVNVHEWD